MPIEITVSIITSVIGIIVGAVVNHLLSRKKYTAEIEEIKAKAEKTRAEAEKTRAEILPLNNKNKLLPNEEIKEQTNNRTSKHTDTPPDAYDIKYLTSEVAERFGQQIGFLVIHYGSSVKNILTANDEDYIILVHGNFYHGEVSQESIGHIRRPTTHLSRPIDIHIRLFDSFLIGLIMGKPFEVSVVKDGKVKDSHQMPPEYWGWLKALASNSTVSTPYLMERITDDIQELRQEYIVARKAGLEFNFIISAYHYVCSLIQLRCLTKFPYRVPTLTIYPLSQTSYLMENIASTEGKLLFKELVDYFKRNKTPADWRVFENNVDKLLLLMQGEIQNVQ